MTEEFFIQPRFDGPRFDGHTLPVSAAKDLAAYEELVLELAKHLYREKHDDRTRVPKGFAEGFGLHLEKIDEGSVRPVLVAVVATVGALGLPSSPPPEIIEARELINQVIATADGEAFPANFPKNLYSYFNRLGRSLLDGERIEWTPDALDNKSVLTPEKRKRLVLAHRETYEAEVVVVGLVEELDSKKSSGVLRTLEGETVAISFEDPFFGGLKRALGEERIGVRLSGVGVFDVNERLTSLKEIEQLESLSNYQLTAMIERLADLSDGWLEGGGKAPAPELLDWLTGEIADRFPSMEYPSVAPTEDGNVVLEWIRPRSRIELEVAADGMELYATNVDNDSFAEEKFAKEDWDGAFAKVAALLET